jgi:hypothetical protein
VLDLNAYKCLFSGWGGYVLRWIKFLLPMFSGFHGWK